MTDEKKKKPITTSAESHFEPPEKLIDTLEVPPDTIYLIPDHPAFVNPTHFEKLVVERDWFTSFFYFCLPLTFGSQHGFIMRATYDFVVRWNGLAASDAVDVHILEELKDPNFIDVSSHFGHGIVTVQSRFTFRTPKGVNLMVKEPPNYYVDGFSWLNAVVETDNLRRDFTFNIKITRPHCDIYIRKGTPLGCIVPYPRYFLDKYRLEELKDPEELRKAQRTIGYFSQERADYDFSKPRLRYMEGKDIYDLRFEHHQKTLDSGRWWHKGAEQTGCPQSTKGIDATIQHPETNESDRGLANKTPTGQPQRDKPLHNTSQQDAGNNDPLKSQTCPVNHGGSASSDSLPATSQSTAADGTTVTAQCPMSGVQIPNNVTELNKYLEDDTISIFLKPGYDATLAPVRASKARAWMEEDVKTRNHAKFCLPLITASGVGHFILSPATFTVEWDGDEAHDVVVTIHDAASHAEITTHSACGSVTIQSKLTLRTKQPGDYVYVKGIANQIRQPYHVLEAMIEAWWAPATFGIVMILNQPTKFKIEKGQPIAQMFAVSREKADFDAKVIEGSPPRLAEWMDAEELRVETGKHFLYFKGLWPDGEAVSPHYPAWGLDPVDLPLTGSTTPYSKPAGEKKTIAAKESTTGEQAEYLEWLVSAFRLVHALPLKHPADLYKVLSPVSTPLIKKSNFPGMTEILNYLITIVAPLNSEICKQFESYKAERQELEQVDNARQKETTLTAAKECIERLKSNETKELAFILNITNPGMGEVTALIEGAHNLQSKGKPHEAETLVTLALQILWDTAPSDSRIPHALDFVTYVCGRQAKLHESLRWYFRISSQSTSGVYLQASCLNNLGFSFKAKKKFQPETEICFKESWKMIQADEACSMHRPRFLEDLAFFYRDWDKWELAEKLFQALVQIRDRSDCAPADRARSHNDLAYVLNRGGGDKAKAEEHFRKALSILEATPETTRQQLAQQLERLAAFYRQHNRISEAVPLFNRAVEIRKQLQQ